MTVCMICAVPRSQPKPLPVFLASPAPRPEGDMPALALRFVSAPLTEADFARGEAEFINAAQYVRCIKIAGDQRRSIRCYLDCAGGNAKSFMAVAVAVLEHPFAVHCRIIGRCSSSAALIALAADKRTITDTGYVLLHAARRFCTPAQWDAMRTLPQSSKDEINGSLNDIDDAQVALLMQRLGVSEDAARRWLAEDRKWTPEEALARGFVREIEGE